MPEIQAGDEIHSDWWPAAVENDDTTNFLDITSTSYTAGSPECSVLFEAPRSGRVAVCIAAGLQNQDAGDRVFLSWECYLGTSASGTLVQSAVDTHGVSTSGGPSSLEGTWANMVMLQGLTPGATYFARTMHRVDGGTTNDVHQRRIIVFPLP
jgi:hypothetical protein